MQMYDRKSSGYLEHQRLPSSSTRCPSVACEPFMSDCGRKACNCLLRCILALGKILCCRGYLPVLPRKCYKLSKIKDEIDTPEGHLEKCQLFFPRMSYLLFHEQGKTTKNPLHREQIYVTPMNYIFTKHPYFSFK